MKIFPNHNNSSFSKSDIRSRCVSFRILLDGNFVVSLANKLNFTSLFEIFYPCLKLFLIFRSEGEDHHLVKDAPKLINLSHTNQI